MAKKRIKAYFCPKCNSTNVQFVFGFGNLFGILPKMKCSDCAFFLNGNFPQVVTYVNNNSGKKKYGNN